LSRLKREGKRRKKFLIQLWKSEGGGRDFAKGGESSFGRRFIYHRQEGGRKGPSVDLGGERGAAGEKKKKKGRFFLSKKISGGRSLSPREGKVRGVPRGKR